MNSVSGLPTEGVGVLFTKDANGDVVAGSVEIIHWTGIGGSSLTLTDTGDRGLTGSDAAAQAYSAGAYFEVWVTSYYYTSLLSGITAAAAASIPTSYLDTDGTLAANSDVKVSTQKAVKTYVTANATPADGWTAATGTWTYASADAPTFTITVPSGAASLYGVGMRIKLTQTTVKYFIITGVADTVLTVYGGTDYTLANAAISAISVSPMKAPLGFPLDPTKWTVRIADATERSGTIDGTNWLNIGTTNSQLSMPIGLWHASYSVYFHMDRTTAGTDSVFTVTLSTANNTQSDAEMTATNRRQNPGSNEIDLMAATFQREKFISASSKTLYYLNAKCDAAGNGFFNEFSRSTTVIQFVCAYL